MLADAWATALMVLGELSAPDERLMSRLVACLLLFATRPFDVGDTIDAGGGHYGIVKQVDVLGLAAAVVGPSRVGALSDAAVSSLLGCGCRSFEDVRGLEAAAVEGLAEGAEVRVALDAASASFPLRWAKAHDRIDIAGEGGALLQADQARMR